MKKTPVLRLVNVTKVISKRTIVDNLSLDIYPGEILGLLGPNGAGKTTTLRMLVGLTQPTSGSITISGYSLRDEYSKAIKQVGGIIDCPDMYPFLTGYQKLQHFARICGIKRCRIDEVVKLVGLEARIHEKARTYLLGMRQRLGLAHAILHKPALLILDEPMNGLDPAGIKEMREHIIAIAKTEKVGVLLSSHLLSEIELMCDHIAILHLGKLLKLEEVQGDKKQTSIKSFILEVSYPYHGKMLYRHIFPLRECVSMDNFMEVKLFKEEMTPFVKILLDHGIEIFGINERKTTLAMNFMDIAGDKTI